jgi:DNA end-binding protein Ku
MARAVWSGAISFGLVNIPVSALGAREQKKISFHMLDSEDNAPIGYKKFNKTTGKEVPTKRIVKGFEHKKGEFVIVTDADFKKANPVATQTIDIEDFVEVEDIDILMFEKPYYLVPTKAGRKGYVLLRKVLEETKKGAIARFVMHQKEHLVAIIPRGPYLILETLRYAEEVKEVDEADYLDDADLSKIKVSPRELKMAEELVSGMTSKWAPEKYKDTYQADLMKFIKLKIKNGETEEAAEVEEVDWANEKKVVDLMPLLKKSLEASKSGSKKSTSKKAPAKNRRAH